MQTELDFDAIRILGVNQLGAETGNIATCNGRDIPWLQDIAGKDVWVSWEVRYRDVVILDETGVKVAVFNLTDHDLGDPESFAELKALLQTIAGTLP